MNTILIIVLVIAVIAGGVYVGTKYFGLTKDEDKDGIPDKVEDAAKEVKTRAKRVKQELKDVSEAVKDVAEQAGDVIQAAKGGSKRKGRKPRKKAAPKTTGTTKRTGGSGGGYDKGDYYKTKR